MTYIPWSPLSSRAALLFSRAQLSAFVQRSSALQSFLSAVSQLFQRIGKPLLVVRPMQNGCLPYLDDHANMTQESAHDVASLQVAIPEIAQQGIDLYNYTVAESESALAKLTEVQDAVRTARARLAGWTPALVSDSKTQLSGAANQLGEELSISFKTANALIMGDSSSITYHADAGLVTLQELEALNASLGATVNVSYLSPEGDLLGLPGSTTEVSTTPDTSSGQEVVAFTSGTVAHDDPAAMLDESALTWFEFERCALVSDRQPCVQIDGGYRYSGSGTPQDIYTILQPDTWSVQVSGPNGPLTMKKMGMPPQHELTCVIDVTFASETVLSMITLDPLLPAAGSAAYIDSVLGKLGDGTTVSLYTRGKDGGWLGATTVLPVLETRALGGVIVTLKQPAPYRTLVGHVFYLASVQDSEVNPGFLGFGAGSSTGSRTLRVATPDDAQKLNETWTTHHGLFGMMSTTYTTTLTGIRRGIDVFQGKRWQIGLRTLACERARYAPTGYVTFAPVTFQRPIQSASLSPVGATPAGAAVTYTYRSGEQWIPITPGHAFALDAPTASLQIRAYYARRDESQNDSLLTPVLSGLTVRGVYA